MPLLAACAVPVAGDARAQARALLLANLDGTSDTPETRAATAACAEERMSDEGIAALVAARSDAQRRQVILAENVPSPFDLRFCAFDKVSA
ncbi:hypothetical protein [Yoonia sp. 208BN28-4]|uniref:hypothetical protein n=1 Tax=Yoonia sp. 208BN28-4 TaxID=3126505 RepID=UPI0030AB5CA8